MPESGEVWKLEEVGEKAGPFRRREGRKEDWVGRVLDCGAMTGSIGKSPRESWSESCPSEESGIIFP